MPTVFAGLTSIIASIGILLSATALNSQPPQDPRRADNPPRSQRPPRRGGFQPPPPPLLEALDADRDGEIAADEVDNAVTALRKLDRNKDGELGGDELRPALPFRGRGGFPFDGERGNTERLLPAKLKISDGAANIPDQAAFHRLSYKGEEVMIDTFLAGLEFVKFTLDRAASAQRQLYFINTKTHRAHMMFARVAGLSFGRGGDQMKGVLVYRPMLKSPSGKPGLYTFEFEPFDAYSFKMVKLCQDQLIEKMPLLQGNLGYYPRGNGAIARVGQEKALYDGSDVKVYFDEDLNNTDIGFLPLNQAESFGRLRLMSLEDRPGPRDIVLYNTLPNEMPRVAGVITTVRQTPLSHVNLRAIQDRVPNAFIANADSDSTISTLIGKYVCYKVTDEGFEIREAETEEVDAHFADLRPATSQVPKRDLTVKKIRPLGEVGFRDSLSVGVKAANLAAMRKFGFPEGTVPDGFAVPFYFYDEFMKYNGFYDYVAGLLKNPEFLGDRDTQEAQLNKLKKLIKKGKMPEWMMAALGELQRSFPEGTSIRCRSSTNNEDLPRFSGAGLYDSYTHHPDEGHFSKSIKQVFASLWNYRAFEEREFYRVDHLSTAMGVLVHPNFSDELANGVAVSDDILYQTQGNYYVNTQVGEDLVTNPDDQSVPEELLLGWWERDGHRVMRRSNRVSGDNQILSDEHLGKLRSCLSKVHSEFSRLYGRSLEDRGFAMEVEFKVTRDGVLAIKQARPWVFAGSTALSTEE